MSFFSYKNANSDQCPGSIVGSATQGLTERICVQVKNVFYVIRDSIVAFIVSHYPESILAQ